MGNKKIPGCLSITNYQAIARKNIRESVKKKRFCVFKNNECTEIIKAHSIQEAALRKISTNATVLTFGIDTLAPKDNRPAYMYTRINSINTSKASTFSGLCKYHDKSVFSCIEDMEIIPNQLQNSRLYFRGLTFSWYSNKVMPEAMEILYAAKLPDGTNRKKEKEILKSQIPLQKMTLDELQTNSENYAKKIVNGNDIPLKFLLIRIDRIPEIMFCNLHAPFIDFLGNNILNYLKSTARTEYCCMTISADKLGGYISIVWPDDMVVVDKYIESWKKIDFNFNKLIVKIMTNNDNYFFQKTWWDCLSVIKKRQLMTYNSGYYMMLHERKSWIENQLEFKNDWRKYVNWNISDMKSNCL